MKITFFFWKKKNVNEKENFSTDAFNMFIRKRVISFSVDAFNMFIRKRVI